jgi:hypothetical protein
MVFHAILHRFSGMMDYGDVFIFGFVVFLSFTAVYDCLRPLVK